MNTLRLGVLASTALCLLSTGGARASEFDVPTGAVRFAPDALKAYGFESLADMADLYTVKWKTGGGFAPTGDLAKADAALLTPMMLSGDAVEGKGSLRLTTVTGGIALADPAFFAAQVTSRLEFSMWGRGEGVAPNIILVYGKPDWPFSLEFAIVPSIRTGRQTSDGWIEVTTGALDGSVWGVPIRAVLIGPSQSAPKGTGFAIDALEVRKVPGSIQAANACTLADMDKTCGPQGDCLYGRCVTSTVTWGALPPTAHRTEFAERWIHVASRLVGDRKASAFGRDAFTKRARDLARYALSSRQFFGGINRLVNELRDNHTSFGGPSSQNTLMSPMTPFGWSAGLHACFGLMDKDLLGGGQAFGVFFAGDKPAIGVPLKVGDILLQVDGVDAIEWAKTNLPSLGRTATNDPAGALAGYADDMAYAITQRATNIKIARCTSATKCTGDDKKEFTIDVGPKLFAAIAATGDWSATDYFGCSPRFRPSVDKLDEGVRGEDTITAQTKGAVVNVQFDGFSGQTIWKDKMGAIFTASPAKVLMDTRQGNGGTGDNVQALLDLMRTPAEPVGFMTVMNGSWQDPSPSDLFTRYGACTDGTATSFWPCFGAWGFFTSVDSAPGMKSKVAWLNSIDVSANDYMPRLLQGRSKLRIFAPHATSGAFGAITQMSSVMPGFGGGSIQYQDSRFGTVFDELPTKGWESGHGVVPDEVVTQKQSDALNGKDTILEAANAWLAKD